MDNNLVEYEKWNTENFNDKAYHELKKQIFKGKLKPGTRLIDSELAKRYGISRTPIRDAIIKLAAEGYVVPSTPRGYEVFKATEQDIFEVMEIRRILETAILTKLINEIVPKDPEYYKSEFLRIEKKLTDDISSKEFYIYDEDFHDGIVSLCQNDRLVAIYSQIRNQTRAFRLVASISTDRVDGVNAVHKRIINALECSDLEGTLLATNEHIDFTLQLALADFA